MTRELVNDMANALGWTLAMLFAPPLVWIGAAAIMLVLRYATRRSADATEYVPAKE